MITYQILNRYFTFYEYQIQLILNQIFFYRGVFLQKTISLLFTNILFLGYNKQNIYLLYKCYTICNAKVISTLPLRLPQALSLYYVMENHPNFRNITTSLMYDNKMMLEVTKLVIDLSVVSLTIN